MIETPIKKVEDILSLKDLLVPTINQINRNLKRYDTKVMVLEWVLHFYPNNRDRWQGRIWLFLSTNAFPGVYEVFENTLFHIGSGGSGALGISNSTLTDAKKCLTHPQKVVKYKNKEMYTYSFACSVFLEELPGYKVANFLEDKDPEPISKAAYDIGVLRYE